MEPWDQEFWNFEEAIIDISQIRYIRVLRLPPAAPGPTLEITLADTKLPIYLENEQLAAFINWFQKRFEIEIIEGWEPPDGSRFS